MKTASWIDSIKAKLFSASQWLWDATAKTAIATIVKKIIEEELFK